MGERGNICVKQARGQVWFYTHWRGHEIQTVVANALKKKERWDDEEYLARIIFDELRGDDTGTTGFGISTCMGDNSYPIVVVDCTKKAVFIVNEDQLFLGQPPEHLQGGILFSDFCEQTLADAGAEEHRKGVLAIPIGDKEMKGIEDNMNDLLEALKEAVRLYETRRSDGNGFLLQSNGENCECGEWVNQARAAIAKVTGGAQ